MGSIAYTIVARNVIRSEYNIPPFCFASRNASNGFHINNLQSVEDSFLLNLMHFVLFKLCVCSSMVVLCS